MVFDITFIYCLSYYYFFLHKHIPHQEKRTNQLISQPIIFKI